MKRLRFKMELYANPSCRMGVTLAVYRLVKQNCYPEYEYEKKEQKTGII